MNTASFPTPAIFNWLQAQGNIDTDEMYHIFNMGIGFTLIVAPEDEVAVHEILKMRMWTHTQSVILLKKTVPFA